MARKAKIIILGSGYNEEQELPQYEEKQNLVMSNLYAYGFEQIDVDSVDYRQPRQSKKSSKGNAFEVNVTRIAADIGCFLDDRRSPQSNIQSIQGIQKMMAHWEATLKGTDYEAIVVINGDGDGNVELLFQSYRKANRDNRRVLFVDWCTCCMTASCTKARGYGDNVDKEYSSVQNKTPATMSFASRPKGAPELDTGNGLLCDMRDWYDTFSIDVGTAQLHQDQPFIDLCERKREQYQSELEALELWEKNNTGKLPIRPKGMAKETYHFWIKANFIPNAAREDFEKEFETLRQSTLLEEELKMEIEGKSIYALMGVQPNESKRFPATACAGASMAEESNSHTKMHEFLGVKSLPLPQMAEAKALKETVFIESCASMLDYGALELWERLAHEEPESVLGDQQKIEKMLCALSTVETRAIEHDGISINRLVLEKHVCLKPMLDQLDAIEDAEKMHNRSGQALKF